MRSRSLVLLALAFVGCGGQNAGVADDDGGHDAHAGMIADGPDLLDAAAPADATIGDAPSLFGDVYLPPDDAGSPPKGDGAALPLPCAASGICPNGCCLPDNTCVTTTSANACGTGGQACVACAAGDTCDGACVHPQPNCGPTNCAGCCVDANTCATTGTTNVACGSGGQACQSCGADPRACVARPDGGGFCTSCPLCGGCCVGGTCTMGLRQVACGNGAEDCQACTGGEQCIFMGAGGACVVPEAGACGPSNCAGCCDGDVCAIGDQVIACGTGGAECVNCGIYGDGCTSGACK